MEIYLNYQDRESSLKKAETPYGSNTKDFSELLKLALEGVGLTMEDLKDADSR